MVINEAVNQKSLVVLFPGLNGSKLELGQLPKYIEESGYDVAVPEILGYEHGSPASNLEGWLEQANGFLDAKTACYHHIHLVGISMGATLASVVCSQRSDIFSLILLSPVLRYDGWSVPWYRPLLNIAWILGLKDWEYSEREPFGLKNIELRKRVKDRFKSSRVSEAGSISISSKHLYEAARLMSLAVDELPRIHSKLLVIQSVEDDVCSVWSAETILKNVASDVRRSIWLGNSYHIITIDNEREIVLNEVIHFLDTGLGHEEGRDTYQARANIKSLKARGILK
jgi:carboxylesterase